jgi:ATP-dependent Lon protease
MRAPRSANRDLALQLAAVRALAGDVPPKVPEMRARGARIGELVREARDEEDLGPDGDVERDETSPSRPLFWSEDLAERLAWARRLRQDTQAGLVPELERAAKMGAMRRVGVPGSSLEFQELRDQFPNFTEVLDFVWKRVLLAGIVAGAEFRLPPLLLDGPPGCGKTAFAERLAQWLRVPIARVDMSSLNASFAITGLDAGYSTGNPGVIWNLLQGEFLSPVVLLDEIDKTRALNSEAGSTFLLGLLEPVTACRFKDAFVGLPIDASYVQWIATSNDLSAIDAPLRSRFRVFEVREPEGDECVHVVRSVYRALRERESWARSFPEELPGPVVDALMERTARDVWQALEDACAAAVADGRRQLRNEDIPPARSSTSRPIGFVPVQHTRRLA